VGVTRVSEEQRPRRIPGTEKRDLGTRTMDDIRSVETGVATAAQPWTESWSKIGRRRDGTEGGHRDGTSGLTWPWFARVLAAESRDAPTRTWSKQPESNRSSYQNAFCLCRCNNDGAGAECVCFDFFPVSYRDEENSLARTARLTA
jgi:hypothetical protein